MVITVTKMITVRVHQDGTGMWTSELMQRVIGMAFGPLARRLGVVPREKGRKTGGKKEEHMAQAVEAYRWMGWNK
ncbi:MAG: hypothetical protein A4E32_00971 [Methanomassiliicoccales archaeon PtaU1.Bin124]|nr:MAG: hypothetical protein A4E32_00971 [Methanomassiliicoccales archaeon PtaU1.Bin124]